MEIIIMNTNQLTLSLHTHGDTKEDPGSARSRYLGYNINKGYKMKSQPLHLQMEPFNAFSHVNYSQDHYMYLWISQEIPSFNYLSLRSRKISGSTNYNDSSPPIHLDFYDAFH